jgi:hypothetical protein
MSEEREDHVRIALENLGAADKAANGSQQEMGWCAAAQVHATLALVEQQRLANLIALADHANARWGNYAGEAGGMGTLFSYGETETDNMRIRDDIREALGLS